jgi:hypothetical protein
VPSASGAGSSLPLSGGMPPRGRRRPSLEAAVDAAGPAPAVAHRAPVEAIEAAGVAARATGHVLAGFVRRCTTTGCGFIARCRVCGVEVAVHRGAAGWGHSPPLPACGEARTAGGRAGVTSPQGA